MNESKPWISNRTYDFWKYVAQIFLPAFGALYFGLSQIWGLPKGGEVVGTITVIDTFLGVLLKLSTNQYNNSEAKYDGKIDVMESDGENTTLGVSMNPASVASKKEVVFKVDRAPEV